MATEPTDGQRIIAEALVRDSGADLETVMEAATWVGLATLYRDFSIDADQARERVETWGQR